MPIIGIHKDKLIQLTYDTRFKRIRFSCWKDKKEMERLSFHELVKLLL